MSVVPKEEEIVNPLVPTATDGTLMVAALVALALALVAFISLVRFAPRSGCGFLAWTLVVVLVPFIGPAAWLEARRRQRSTERRRAGAGA